jgi:hypothetical protein
MTLRQGGQAEAVVGVCEAGLAALVSSGVKIERQHRTAYANAVREAISQREADPVEPVIEGMVEGNGLAIPAGIGTSSA